MNAGKPSQAGAAFREACKGTPSSLAALKEEPPRSRFCLHSLVNYAIKLLN
jgi:hypothetical protein